MTPDEARPASLRLLLTAESRIPILSARRTVGGSSSRATWTSAMPARRNLFIDAHRAAFGQARGSSRAPGGVRGLIMQAGADPGGS